MSAGTVAHVVRSNSFAGVERYITETAAELSRRGWSVTVIGGDQRRMTAGLPAGVNHRPGATVAQVSRALAALGRCDIVHAHMTAAELPAALLKWRYQGRLFVTRHFATARGRSPLGKLARPIIGRQVDTQIAISRFVADSLGEPSTVIYNGVRPAAGPQSARSNTVILLQRLEVEKDAPTALRAWSESRLAAEGWRLVIYGRGTQERALRDLTGQLCIAESVHFGGFLDDTRAALSRAAVMVAPAPAEPFGLAVVEAMAEGTPVIAAGGGGHLETVGSEQVFFTPGDASGCAELLGRLAHSPELRQTLGDRMRLRANKLFTITAHVDALEACYLPQG